MRPRQRDSFDPGRRRFLRSAAGGAAAVAVGGPALLASCSADSDAAAQPADPKAAEAARSEHACRSTGSIRRVCCSRTGVRHRRRVRQPGARPGRARRRVPRPVDGSAAPDGRRAAEQRRGEFPPTDSGVFGDELPPAELSVIVGVGASLFDDRYGLASRKPRELVRMPFIANDRLDPARSHGDVSVDDLGRQRRHVQLRAAPADAAHAGALHAALDGRRLQHDPGRLRRRLRARSQPPRVQGRHREPRRHDDDLMQELVWVGPDAREPRWADGGSYQAIRIIRMFVEFWDRTRLDEQEAMIGRHKLTARRSAASRRTTTSTTRATTKASGCPLDAHIRLANPRTRRDREAPDPAPRLLLLPRLRRGRPARPGPALQCASRPAWTTASSRCRND